jgi:hypothetical protein
MAAGTLLAPLGTVLDCWFGDWGSTKQGVPAAAKRTAQEAEIIVRRRMYGKLI